MITLVALSDLELKIIGALIFHSPKNTRWCRKWVKKTDISIASHVSDIPTKFFIRKWKFRFITPIFIKLCVHLDKFINSPFRSSKISRVTPVTDTTNYRAVNALPNLSKIFDIHFTTKLHHTWKIKLVFERALIHRTN